ncbi:MAG: cytochrome c biogenesis protein ResB [Chloroflexota bacterium]|nr:cytochrome c biogenesis protein ResB [Chloroflexota bacterium]
MAASGSTAGVAPRSDRLAVGAERLLRVLGDARLGLVLLLLVALANLVAALLPDGPALLEGWPYAALLGALAVSAVAAVAVRLPATWREWQRPGPVAGGNALVTTVPVQTSATVELALRAARYRTRVVGAPGSRRWAVHGVRRGWARFAGQASHLGLVVVVLGAAIGSAFGSETTFSLLPGDQALLDEPRPGFSSAVRLDAFTADFDAGDRPVRLDTEVTFLRDGAPIDSRRLRVNEPGGFDGYLVHPWTYGPAARLRVTTLDGAALLDASVALDATQDGATPVGSVELPTVGLTLGLALADASANLLGASVVGPDGLADAARLRPGEEARLGDVVVTFDRFDAWVTLMARRDPGLGILFAGAGLLCLSLAVAFWLPRRRVTVRPLREELSLSLRGERFDDPRDELDRLIARLGGPA